MASSRVPPIWHVFRCAVLAFAALAALGLITELTRTLGAPVAGAKAEKQKAAPQPPVRARAA